MTTGQWQRAALWLFVLAPAAAAALASRGCIHFFQLESYQFPGYFRTLRRQWKRAFLPGALVCAACAALGLLLLTACARLGLPLAAAGAVFLLALLLCGAALHRNQARMPAKKPMVKTPRVKRLFVVYCLLLAALAALLADRCPPLLPLIPLCAPLLVALAGLIAWPLEKLISELYFRDAQRMLREHAGLIRIGITGSYGKTSVKFILSTILSEKFNVLATPGSFNTPMGLTRIVRERLRPAHQVFLAEMGARHVGDIKELCRLVRPSIGVLTSVGPQHLDTFKTLERVQKTKFELMRALPPDGMGFFADDGGPVRALYERMEKPKALTGSPAGAAYAQNVRVTPQGSAFDLCLDGEPPIPCRTALLGEHNIQNIVLACAVARHLGMDARSIARGVSRLEAVEHRLKIVSNAGGVTVIDDAFNSNPAGSRAALRVLRAFPARRIVVTPGMVELGAQEDAFNRAFGQEMAACADIAILVGKKHTEPIARGLESAGFDMQNAHAVASLEEAVALLRGIARAGDTVLYENDLPDHYSE